MGATLTPVKPPSKSQNDVVSVEEPAHEEGALHSSYAWPAVSALPIMVTQGNDQIVVAPQGRPSLLSLTPSFGAPDTSCLERRTISISVNAWRCRRKVA
jgi:hypothetical protein